MPLLHLSDGCCPVSLLLWWTDRDIRSLTLIIPRHDRRLYDSFLPSGRYLPALWRHWLLLTVRRYFRLLRKNSLLLHITLLTVPCLLTGSLPVHADCQTLRSPWYPWNKGPLMHALFAYVPAYETGIFLFDDIFLILHLSIPASFFPRNHFGFVI